MPRLKLNPFIYGKPVPSTHFIGREEAIRTLFSRLHNGESTAIVGEPHIGKSSLLRYISNDKVRSEWLGRIAEQCAFIEIDCQLLPGDYQPVNFWQHVLNEMEVFFPYEEIKKRLDIVRQNNYGSFTLKGFFDFVARNDRKVVLLIDEFDVLLHHPHFNTAEFFGALRSLATSTDGLVLVTAARQSITQMNRRSEELNPLGSPFFNNFTEVRLFPLQSTEIDMLLEKTLEGTEVSFSPHDSAYIKRMSGHHPFLVHTAGSALFDSIVQGLKAGERYDKTGAIIHQRIGSHFDDLWKYLSPQAQTVMVILSLADMKGRIDDRDFDTGDFCSLDWYGPELRELTRLGLVERDTGSEWSVELGFFALWSGERWRISALSFILWVIDSVIAGTRDRVSVDKLLHDKEYDGLLTKGDKDRLKKLANTIPKSTINETGKLLRMFLKGLLTSD